MPTVSETNLHQQVKYAEACEHLLHAYRYLKEQGLAATEGPRRILTAAFKIVGTDKPGVEMLTPFEQWWKETFEGKLSGAGVVIEQAFKEVAQQAWRAGK